MVCKHIVHESGRETSSLSPIFSEGRGASVHRLMKTRLYITKWYNREPDLDYVTEKEKKKKKHWLLKIMLIMPITTRKILTILQLCLMFHFHVFRRPEK